MDINKVLNELYDIEELNEKELYAVAVNASRIIKHLQAELTQLKSEKSGEWVDVGVSDFDDTDRCYRCSVCGKEINGYDIGYYFKFCHGCGAKMEKEANQ